MLETKGTRKRKGRALLWAIEPLMVISLLSVGFSSWSVSFSEGASTGSIDAQAGSVVAIDIDLLSLDKTKGDGDGIDELEYCVSDYASGLVSDDVIGTSGSIGYHLLFDMASLSSELGWGGLTISFSLSYASGVSGLSLLNSSLGASLSYSETTKSGATSTTTASKDASLTTVSLTDSLAEHTVSFSSGTYTILNLSLTYSFTVSDASSEATALSSISGSVFHLSMEVSQA